MVRRFDASLFRVCSGPPDDKYLQDGGKVLNDGLKT